MEGKEITELISVFKEIVDRSSDKNMALAELAQAQRVLMESLSRMSFNEDGKDLNGNQSKYKAMTDQVKRLDDLMVKLK